MHAGWIVLRPPVESSKSAGTPRRCRQLARGQESFRDSRSAVELRGTCRFFLPLAAFIRSRNLGSSNAASGLGCGWRVARRKRHLEFPGKLPVLFLLRVSTLFLLVGFSISLWFGHLIPQTAVLTRLFRHGGTQRKPSRQIIVPCLSLIGGGSSGSTQAIGDIAEPFATSWFNPQRLARYRL